MTTDAQDEALVALVGILRERGYGFVTVTPATQARVNARPGNALARDLAGVFGWSRPFAPGLLPEAVVGLMRQAGVLVAGGGTLRSSVRVSSLDGHLFVHSAYPTTAPDSVFFGPDTYRFANVIRAQLRQATPARAVDIGCGAGPGAVLVSAAAPRAEVLAVDINEAALRLTRVNSRLAGVTVQAVRSDLLSGAEGMFDLIVSNPPYLLDPGERAYRHGGGALGEGLSLRILDASLARLAPGGTLILYTGVAIVAGHDPFRAAAAPRLRGLDWAYAEADPDVFGEELETPAYAGTDRIAAVVLTATRPSG